jgi:hypothetical protein
MTGLSKARILALLHVFFSGTILAVTPLSSVKENKVINLTNNGEISNLSVPPIDTSAPAKTETATFALG